MLVLKKEGGVSSAFKLVICNDQHQCDDDQLPNEQEQGRVCRYYILL